MTGEAELQLEEDALVVSITATGVESDRILSQYIKGFTTTARARCPTEAGGAGRVVDRREGRSAYGRTLFAIQPFPVLAGGTADANRDGTARYVPNQPVACGEIAALD